jgi:hypothetical protein
VSEEEQELLIKPTCSMVIIDE